MTDEERKLDEEFKIKLKFLKSKGFVIDEETQTASKQGYTFSFAILKLHDWDFFLDTASVLGD